MRSSRGIWKDIPEVCLGEVTPKLIRKEKEEERTYSICKWSLMVLTTKSKSGQEHVEF